MNKIYNKLMGMYGHQGWWPVTPCYTSDKLKPMYGIKTRIEKQKLEIIIGAILTQSTAWKNVEKAITELNKRNLIDVNKILKISDNELAQIIRSSGYYNQKAKKLKNIAEFLKKYPIKKLENIDINEARKLLLSVKGIGKETADSILLYALNKPIFVVDAYTRRIFSNLGLISPNANYDEIQALFMNNLPNDSKLFNEYHALIVEHAKRYYRKKEDYKKCPLYVGYFEGKKA